jgi:pimeloyl-ACP methyl ester carboxylesterase
LAQRFLHAVSGQPGSGREFLKRFRLRTKDRDPEVNDKVPLAQRAAIAKWAAPRERPYDYLKTIQQSTLVVNGSTDPIICTVNSFILQQNLPNAQLIIYPDSAHGSHHQYPELFVRHASMFLSATDVWPA